MTAINTAIQNVANTLGSTTIFALLVLTTVAPLVKFL